MTEIFGHIDTERKDKDWYQTIIDWTVPADPADDDAMIRAASKRFEKVLRRTIQAHHNGE